MICLNSFNIAQSYYKIKTVIVLHYISLLSSILFEHPANINCLHIVNFMCHAQYTAHLANRPYREIGYLCYDYILYEHYILVSIRDTFKLHESCNICHLWSYCEHSCFFPHLKLKNSSERILLTVTEKYVWININDNAWKATIFTGLIMEREGWQGKLRWS